MIDIKIIIGNNIKDIMKKKHRSIDEMAEHLGLSRKKVARIIHGAVMLNADELQNISVFLNVSINDLIKLPSDICKGITCTTARNIKTLEAKEGLQIAYEIADMICFYSRVHENAEELMKPVNDI